MATPGRIRILCADDHPLVRDGIAFALLQEPDMELVADVRDGKAAIEAYRKHRPDVTLMDLQMPVMNGLEALSALREEFPDAKVIVLTTYSGDVQASKALRLGAASYLLKDMLRTDLVETIRSVHSGKRKISAGVATVLAEHFDADELSPREIDVLRSAAAGRSNKIIAEGLGITEQTVKGYMKSVFSKLKANDRTHAVMIAMRRGFLDV
jgi:DNA-binding NarL/FixJ family response regulator